MSNVNRCVVIVSLCGLVACAQGATTTLPIDAADFAKTATSNPPVTAIVSETRRITVDHPVREMWSIITQPSAPCAIDSATS